MPKLNPDISWDIEAILAQYEAMDKRRAELDRKDWFLVEVKFTPEAVATHKKQTRAYNAAVREMMKRAPGERTNAPMHPGLVKPLQAFDALSDVTPQSERLTWWPMSKSKDGTTEQVAIRACMFEQLLQKTYIEHPVNIIASGEKVADMVAEKRVLDDARAQRFLRASRHFRAKKNPPGPV